MSDKYTPTTEWLAKHYPPGVTPKLLEEVHDWFEIPNKQQLLEAIVRHDREVAAKALREAAENFRYCPDYGYRATRWRATEDYLNNRAAAIERGE